jgi:hypothetical protein
MRLLKIEPGAEILGRLALIAGAGLALPLLIPLQLERMTCWAGRQGAAWLVNKIPHKGLLFASSGLFAAVFIRLALNPAILDYQPRAEIRIWNWYLYTYLIASAALICGGWLLSNAKISLSSYWPRIVKLFQQAVLLFFAAQHRDCRFLLDRSTITFRFTATLAQDLTCTLAGLCSPLFFLRWES